MFRRIGFFWKVLVSVFVIFCVTVTLISYLSLDKHARDVRALIIEEYQTYGRLASQEIESGSSEREWPFHLLRSLSGLQDFLFWWIVKDDGRIYLANDAAFMGTSTFGYFPEIKDQIISKKPSAVPGLPAASESLQIPDGVLVKSTELYVNDRFNYGVYVCPIETDRGKWTFMLGFSTWPIAKARGDITMFSIIITTLMLAVLYIGLYATVRRFTDPIALLGNAARRIGSGDLDVRVAVRSGDEIGELSGAFNQMAETLQHSQAELQKSAQDLQDNVRELTNQITERERVEGHLHRRDAILDAVGFAAERFLGLSFDESHIYEVLERLGRASGVGRVFICRNQQDAAGHSALALTHEWTAPEAIPLADMLRPGGQTYAELGLERWASVLGQGDMVAGVTREFPVSERLLLEHSGVTSLAAMPIFVENKWWGFIALEERHNERDWPPPEREALLTAARTLGAALHRRRAEEERTRLVAAIDQAAETIIITDTGGAIQYVNPAFERTMGYMRQEVIGKNPRILKSDVYGEEFFRLMWETLLRDGVWGGRLTNRRKDGNLIQSEATISAVRDTESKTTHYVAVERDITHEAHLEAMLRQAQKMEAIGTLAGGIAHDFNNMLSSILGYSHLAMKSLTRDSKAYRPLEQISKAGRRAADLVKQILTFSRQSEEAYRPLAIRLIVKEALKLMRGSLPATIEIQTNVDKCRRSILADPIQIHQVLMNLCTNAFHAMREQGGVLEVLLEDVDVDRILAATHQNLRPGPYVRLTVRDAGHGMETTIVDRIFDPYFTTKETGEGSGLGLAIVHGIVENCRGAITVQSQMGVGTTFQVYFPACGDAASLGIHPIEHRHNGGGHPEGSERVLFIDDEELIVELAGVGLKDLGYNVEAFSDPVKAIERFQHAPEQYDVVVTDQTMPRCTGLSLIEHIRTIRADIPVVLCTGYSETVDEERIQVVGLAEYVMKPIIVDDVARAIRRVMSNRRGPHKSSGIRQSSPVSEQSKGE